MAKIKCNDTANIALISDKPEKLIDSNILVISAGTTDIPVAEEAIFTINSHGYDTQKFMMLVLLVYQEF
ncbi:MAG: hypothetical protein CM15mP91_0990 [Chloroflexota bacterium]|nr:MAG: hypothetical protein CM15mP91_0990 [Chloroflexota bacterium]